MLWTAAHVLQFGSTQSAQQLHGACVVGTVVARRVARTSVGVCLCNWGLRGEFFAKPPRGLVSVCCVKFDSRCCGRVDLSCSQLFRCVVGSNPRPYSAGCADLCCACKLKECGAISKLMMPYKMQACAAQVPAWPAPIVQGCICSVPLVSCMHSMRVISIVILAAGRTQCAHHCVRSSKVCLH
jgi:hypothetical protein